MIEDLLRRMTRRSIGRGVRYLVLSSDLYKEFSDFDKERKSSGRRRLVPPMLFAGRRVIESFQLPDNTILAGRIE